MWTINTGLKLLVIYRCMSVALGVDYFYPFGYGYEKPERNMVKNWDFEDDFAADDSDWYAFKAGYTIVDNDAYTGTRSVLIHSRLTQRFAGLRQDFKNVTANTMYYFSMFIKLPDEPTTPGSLFYTITIYGSDAGQSRIKICRFPDVRNSPRWRQLGGDFEAPVDYPSFRLEIEVSDPGITYMVDTVSLVVLPADPRWEARADVEGDKIRKNMVTLSSTIPADITRACDVTFGVEQVKRHFGIGATLKADKFNEQDDFGTKYRQCFVDLFEHAVFENDCKWKPMEKNGQGLIRFERIDTALDYLESYNITTRGHALVWGILGNSPAWVEALSGEALKNATMYRLKYIVDHYTLTNRIMVWDALNEYLHGRFFSEGIDDPFFIDEYHRKAVELDPNIKLILNDYQAVKSGDYTSALADLGKELQYRNIPVHGIAYQSHLRPENAVGSISQQQIKKRIEIGTLTGIPLTLTEISIHITDVTQRASQLNSLLKTAFANPGVDGCLFWGFSDNPTIGFETETWSMYTGDDCIPNAAGLVLDGLIAAWTTPSVNFTSHTRNMKKRLAAFHGQHNAKVYYKDQLVKTVPFYLHPGGDMNVEIPLELSDFAAVNDNDMERCRPENTDDVDPARPNNRGFGFGLRNTHLKRARLQQFPVVRGVGVS